MVSSISAFSGFFWVQFREIKNEKQVLSISFDHVGLLCKQTNGRICAFR